MGETGKEGREEGKVEFLISDWPLRKYFGDVLFS